MHTIQRNILQLSHTTNLAALKLREIGTMVGEPHPQKIKHHLTQLFVKGLLKHNQEKTIISPVSAKQTDDTFIALPILGSANCGEASLVGEEHMEGFLHVSQTLLSHCVLDELFVVKAAGNSMNRANIKGKAIEDGDYVVIDKRPKDSFDGKYVLSLINGMANIKKLVIDSEHEQVVLLSESTQDYPPIFIHSQDFSADYLINGEVVQVIKNPKKKKYID